MNFPHQVHFSLNFNISLYCPASVSQGPAILQNRLILEISFLLDLITLLLKSSSRWPVNVVSHRFQHRLLLWSLVMLHREPGLMHLGHPWSISVLYVRLHLSRVFLMFSSVPICGKCSLCSCPYFYSSFWCP